MESNEEVKRISDLLSETWSNVDLQEDIDIAKDLWADTIINEYKSELR